MTQRVLSRSQRRMERKQAIVLLCLALAISLVSFSLGVMVGRSGNRPEPVAAAPAPAPLPLPAPQPAPLPPAAPVPGTVAGQAGGQPPEPAEVAPAAKPDENLTFYDTLPRGDQPLGSGINLPPESASKPESAPEPVAPAKPASVATPTSAKAAPANPAPPAAATGQFVVQVASFKEAAAADTMLKKLSGKGYVLFVEPVDLGAKGVWHRIYAGPYAGRETADRVAAQLKEREKISPLVKKR